MDILKFEYSFSLLLVARCSVLAELLDLQIRQRVEAPVSTLNHLLVEGVIVWIIAACSPGIVQCADLYP
jgi:hypothetical protein